MEELFIESFIPVFPDFPFFKYPFEEKKLICDEIACIIKEISIPYYDFISCYEFSFQTTNELPSVAYFNDWYLHLPSSHTYLNCNLRVGIDYDKVDPCFTPYKEHDKNDKEDLVKSVCAKILSDKLFEILVISQLARPGSLSLRDGIVVIGEIKYGSIPMLPNIRTSFSDIIEKGYPPIQFLEFPKFWKWINDNDLLFVRHPKNKFQLAVNAFTYLFGSDNQTNTLVYSMLALEALYVEGKSDITKQLNQRIQLFLGKIKDYKKQINQMYDVRSKFLHGELPLKPKHRESNNDTKYVYLLEESAFLSRMILISTLQHMYLNNLVNIEFELKLKQEIA